MFRTALVAWLLTAAAAPLSAQRLPVSFFAWNQPAASLKEAQSCTFRIYRDADVATPVVKPSTGLVLKGVVCSLPRLDSPKGTYPCVAPIPADTPNVPHAASLTAELNGEETGKLPLINYTFVVVTHSK